MNQRSTEIVQLLSKEKDEITVSGFAEYFQVSQKTIRNDLKEINTILNQNQREEVLIQSGGRINPPENRIMGNRPLPFWYSRYCGMRPCISRTLLPTPGSQL